METTISLNKLLQQILGLPLHDQEWLVDKVQEHICKQEDETEFLSKKQILSEFGDALDELKLKREGKLKCGSARAFLNELRQENVV